MQLFTIGYQGATIAQFWTTLRDNDVELLIDVRATPWSRKTGFAKAALEQAAAENGLNYEHWVTMGCPRDVLTTYRADNDWDSYSEKFWRYLRSREEDVRSLSQVATTYRCALLCFEADADFCHRTYVAGYIQELASEIEIVRLNAHETQLSQTTQVA